MSCFLMSFDVSFVSGQLLVPCPQFHYSCQRGRRQSDPVVSVKAKPEPVAESLSNVCNRSPNIVLWQRNVRVEGVVL